MATKDLREREKEDAERVIEFQMGTRVIHESIRGNLELSSLAPEDLMKALNRSVGKLAFYGSLRADAKRMQAHLETKFETWFVTKMHEAGRNLPKTATEKAKNNIAIMNNLDEYSRRKERLAQISEIVDKLYVLQNSYEIMTKTLQSNLAFRRAELESQMRHESEED